MKHFIAIAVASAALMAGASAQAQDLDYSSGAVAGGNGMTAGSGQTFTVPAGVNRLTSVTLGVTKLAGGSQTYDLQLYPISGNTLGTLVASSAQSIDGAVAFPDQELDTVTFGGGGIVVAPGETYAIVARNPSDPAMYATYKSGNVYPDGDYFRAGNRAPTDEGFFRATFAIAAAPVPTLSEWAMILFGTILAGGAAFHVQRRRFAA